MCNPIDISSSDGGIANYLVNGATIELLIASLNQSQNANLSLLDSDMIGDGLIIGEWSGDSAINQYILDKNLCNGIYSYNGENFGYYLATPSADGGGGSELTVTNWSLIGTYVGSRNGKIRYSSYCINSNI